MYRGRKIAVVMPAHNEGRLIGRSIEQVPAYVDQIIVVDDCSGDDTLEQARLAGMGRSCLFLHHDENMGAGAAIASGYRRAVDEGHHVVAVMAGDAQMDPADLPVLLDPIVEDTADYAKGDRLSWPGVFRSMPFWRFLGNHALSWLTRVISGYPQVRDSQCGYTAASATLLGRLDLDRLYPRYGYPNDLLTRLAAMGARLAQEPVRPVYGEERSGISLYVAFIGVPMVLWRAWRNRAEWRRLALSKG